MAGKRSFVAWAAILMVCFDIAGELVRVGTCVIQPEQKTPAICADPIGPISRFVAQLLRLLSEAPPPEVAPPPQAPPPVVAPQAESPMQRVRSSPSL